MKVDWQPDASLVAIKSRADLLATIRRFMSKRGILEVETPYLSHAYNTDPNIVNLTTEYSSPIQNQTQTLALHSSPEFPMKRMLASGSGSIYQISRVFRDGEQGTQHNPEFTMLEWYRPGFDHFQLMDELEQLLMLLKLSKVERMTYEEVFIRSVGINPHTTTDLILEEHAKKEGFVAEQYDRASLLDFIFSHQVAPNLGNDLPCFISDYPSSQAALARIRVDDEASVAERFELFISGMEIANGYNELSDADELRQRFERENQRCKQRSLFSGPVDENLLAAMEVMPDCAGVAIGLDRLLMVLLKTKNIKDVISFYVDKA